MKQRNIYAYNVYTGRYWDGVWFTARRKSAAPVTPEFVSSIAAMLPAQRGNLLAVYEKRDGRVGDLLLLKQIASPATIHAALKKLLARGLITLRKAPDSRAKYVELTELGLKRYNDLAKAAGK